MFIVEVRILNNVSYLVRSGPLKLLSDPIRIREWEQISVLPENIRITRQCLHYPTIPALPTLLKTKMKVAMILIVFVISENIEKFVVYGQHYNSTYLKMPWPSFHSNRAWLDIQFTSFIRVLCIWNKLLPLIK